MTGALDLHAWADLLARQDGVVARAASCWPSGATTATSPGWVDGAS